MAENTKIEWADHTFNPWIGCTEVSKACTGGGGCDRCYAKVSTPVRVLRNKGIETWGPGAQRVRTKTWGDPVKWNKQHEAFYAQHGRRQRVFCASLADVFDNEVDPQWRADLFELIEATPNLDWLLLTKRIGNVEKLLREAREHIDFHRQRHLWLWITEWYREGNLPPNVWLGATIVNQAEADRDIPKLLQVPAAKRFLSMEPLLGPVKLPRFCACGCMKPIDEAIREAANGPSALNSEQADAAIKKTLGVNWVIVGGESGPGARPMDTAWARSIQQQCASAGVPFFMKQMGGARDKRGALADLPEDLQVREFPCATK